MMNMYFGNFDKYFFYSESKYTRVTRKPKYESQSMIHDSIKNVRKFCFI